VPVREAGYGRASQHFWPTGNERPILHTKDQRYAKALGHPLRARILRALQEREATPTQLAGLLGASVGTVAYHVRTLSSLGLIALTGETRVRGAVAHHYRALASGETTDGELAGAGGAAAGSSMRSLEELADRARGAAAAGGFDRAGSQAASVSLRLDAPGWEEMTQACSQLLERAEAIGEAAAARIARGQGSERDVGVARGQGSDERDVEVALLMFETGSQDS